LAAIGVLPAAARGLNSVA